MIYEEENKQPNNFKFQCHFFEISIFIFHEKKIVAYK